MFAIVVFFVICAVMAAVAVFVRSQRDDGDDARPNLDVLPLGLDGAPQTDCFVPQTYEAIYARVAAERAAFEAYIEGLAAEMGGDHFYSKVVGVSFRNPDRTSRQKLIGMLRMQDELRLDPEPDCKHDPNAVQVQNEFGEQIGYLEKRLAGEVTRSLAKGEQWRCFVSEITGDEERTQGVNIALVRNFVSK